MAFGCRMGWGRQVNAGGIFFKCQLGESCPPKKKVMNSSAGTKGTVDAPYNFLTHACARIIGIESTAWDQVVSIDNIKDVIITYQRRFIAIVDFMRSYLILRDLSVVLVCLYPVARFSFINWNNTILIWLKRLIECRMFVNTGDKGYYIYACVCVCKRAPKKCTFCTHLLLTGGWFVNAKAVLYEC